MRRRDVIESVSDMDVPREGGCACGAVRYRLTSEPLFTHCCHCLNCQRQTGSAFVINLLIEADRVEVLAGDPHPVDAPRDDGSRQRIFRCPVCQVAVFSEYGREEGRFVRGGTLDEPSRGAPGDRIYPRSKLRWVARAACPCSRITRPRSRRSPCSRSSQTGCRGVLRCRSPWLLSCSAPPCSGPGWSTRRISTRSP